MKEKLCMACERGSHEHCSGQILAAKMPCSCEYCWGQGGSTEAHKKAVQKAQQDGRKDNAKRSE